MSSKRRKHEISDDEEETKQEHSEVEETEEPSSRPTKHGEHKSRRSPNFNFPRPPLKRRMSDPGPKASLARIFGPSAEVLYGHKLPVALGIESAHTEEKKHDKGHEEEEHPEAPHDTTGKIKYYAGIAFSNFMADAPLWYKRLILFFLVLNLFVRIGGPYVCGWIIIAEFFVTMCLSHLCYPLQTGGLIVFEGIVMKLVDTHNIYHVVEHNLSVLLLLMFMAAGIYFLRQLLLYIFTQVIVNLENKTQLSLVFMLTAASLSAWLNAVTIVGVLVSVCTGFYAVYHRVATEETLISKGLPLPKKEHHDDDHGHGGGHGHGHDPVDTHDSSDDSQLSAKHNKTLEEFRAFLRSLLIHGIIGTAVGGVFTPVGEPQNLIISTKLDYRFTEYIVRNSPVAVFNAFGAVCVLILLESTALGKQFGYGAPLPNSVRKILEKAVIDEHRKQTFESRLRLYIQAVMLLIFIILLLTDGAAVGLIGLTLLVMVTIFTGICDEHSLGQSFVESLPLCALVVVFLTINAMIEENHLFANMMESVIHHSEKNSYASLFFLNGFLSCISDNIFCGTQFISEMVHQRDYDHISKSDLNLYGVVINAATNIPSIATPNGQPGFLFLYLSALAKFVRLDYRTIVWMTAPYTIVLTLLALAVSVNIRSFTESIVSIGSLEVV